MRARIAPEPIGHVNTGISDYRRQGSAVRRPAAEPVALMHDIDAPGPATAGPPPPPESPRPDTAFVTAVLSGALSPCPRSMQEVFLRTATGWVPPDSDYRLADKKI